MATIKLKGSIDPSFHSHSLIHFIPSSQNNLQHEVKETNNYGDNKDTERLGKEAKNFYEQLLSENDQRSSHISTTNSEKQLHSTDSSNIGRSKSSKKQKLKGMKSSKFESTEQDQHENRREFFQSSLDSNHRQHFKLLQSAQFGHEKEVQNLLKIGLNVNFQDFYGWTPLMCAANEGHSTVVTLLLETGACKMVCNSTGDNASSLARNAGHLQLADLINSFQKRERMADCNNDSFSTEPEKTFYCEICKLEFLEKELKSHYTSTVHLFNSGKKTRSPAYLIPETNRGFQMLLRSGWKTDRGLGPEGKGVKYPVKTVLKQDRKGLGGEQDMKKKARITHFDAEDEDAIKNACISRTFSKRTSSMRTIAKKAQKLKEKKDKRWEKNLRFEFS